MIVLYGVARSRAQRCLWLLEELELPYRLEKVALRDGAHQQPDYLAINPNGKIPALRDGELVLWESLAINLYLAEKYGGALWPRGAEDRGRVFQWSQWAANELEPHLLHLVRPVAPEKAEEADAERNAAVEALKKPFGVLDDALAGRPYLLGERFTVADLNVAAVAAWARWGKMNLAPWHNVGAWVDGCLARPAAKKMIALRMAE